MAATGALHGGCRLRRFHLDGSVDRDIALPVSQPTMCDFARPLLDTLDAAALAAQPQAGGLSRSRPGRTGIPRRCTLAA